MTFLGLIASRLEFAPGNDHHRHGWSERGNLLISVDDDHEAASYVVLSFLWRPYPFKRTLVIALWAHVWKKQTAPILSVLTKCLLSVLVCLCQSLRGRAFRLLSYESCAQNDNVGFLSTYILVPDR